MTVAVYVPTARPVLGVTVKVLLLPAVMDVNNEEGLKLKLLAFGPLKARVSVPVATLLVLTTVTVVAVCAP